MESIRCACAMCRGIGEWIDYLHLLDDRAGPSVRDDERQRIFVLRTNVNEMNVQSIDLGHKLREGVHFCLDLAPVIICRPIACQRLNRRELHALRLVCDRLPFRPLCRVDAPAQVCKFRFRKIHMKRTNSILVFCLLASLWCSTGLGHSWPPFVVLDFLVSHEPTVHRRPDSLTLAGDYIRARTWKLFLTGIYNDLTDRFKSVGWICFAGP